MEKLYAKNEVIISAGHPYFEPYVTKLIGYNNCYTFWMRGRDQDILHKMVIQTEKKLKESRILYHYYIDGRPMKSWHLIEYSYEIGIEIPKESNDFKLLQELLNKKILTYKERKE